MNRAPVAMSASVTLFERAVGDVGDDERRLGRASHESRCAPPPPLPAAIEATWVPCPTLSRGGRPDGIAERRIDVGLLEDRARGLHRVGAAERLLDVGVLLQRWLRHVEQPGDACLARRRRENRGA